ncbi:MAG: hypothetical protein RLZZ44_489, partial [Bacteroidota bacterium]
MAHQIENMFYVGETPWHKLGNQVSEDISISEGMVASGLNWNVGLEELVTVSGRKVQEKAVIRMTDNAVLGVVGPRYQPLQNCDAFNWFQPFLDAKECKLHTAGSLCDGKKIWVLTKLCRPNSEIVKNDEVAKFILLSNSHDGTTAIRVGYTPIRVVCANTLAAAHCSTASKLLRVRHTKNTMTNLEKIRDIMNNMDA